MDKKSPSSDWQRLSSSSQMQVILFWLVAIALGMGFFASYENGRLDWRSISGNLSTELFGGAITYMVLDRILGKREKEEVTAIEKQRLLLELRSHEAGVTQRAVAELRARNWHQDGTLQGAVLRGGNLESVNLSKADLRGADFRWSKLQKTRLWGANLADAINLTAEQMVTLQNLQLAIMPDGELYDGRYNLTGDLWWASEIGVDIEDAEAMAKFYNVSVEAYLVGQAWARENLAELRGE